MTTKQKAVSIANRLGAVIHIDDSEQVYHVTIDAPTGKVWNATNGHSIVSWCYKPFSRAKVWFALLDDMDYGIDDCDNAECDWCNNTKKETP